MNKLGRSPLGGATLQNIKALGFPLSEKKNSEICLFCSYAQTCEPHGRTSPDPRGIIWTNLVEVHKEMLHTKYQGSRPSSFRVEELWNFRSLFQCSTYDPQGGASFDPRGIFMNKLGRDPQGDATYQISNLYTIQFQRKKNLKIGFFVPMFQLVTPRGGASFDPRGII